jgi:hypothetical protein
MAYSKSKLKSSGDRASPCFRPFCIGKLSDKCLPMRIYYMFQLNTFYSTWLISWVPQTLWEYCTIVPSSLNYALSWCIWCTVSSFSHFFSSIWQMQIMWSVVVLLRRNSRRCSPIILSMYGYSIKFCTKLLVVIPHNNYYSQFYHPSCELVQ